jgi:acyl-coenzyme A thioesterase PaaI-like protein
MTQFLRPAKPGELRGHGRVVRRGKDIAFLAGELRNASGDLVATDTASAIVRKG